MRSAHARLVAPEDLGVFFLAGVARSGDTSFPATPPVRRDPACGHGDAAWRCNPALQVGPTVRSPVRCRFWRIKSRIARLVHSTWWMPSFRGILVDQQLDAAGLLIGEQATRPQRVAGAFLRQGVQAVGSVGGPPAADSLQADAEQFGEIGFGVAHFDATQGTQRRRTWRASSDNCRASGKEIAMTIRPFHRPRKEYANVHRPGSRPILICEQLGCQGNMQNTHMEHA